MMIELPDFDLTNSSLNLPAESFPMLITGVAGVAGFNAFAYFRAKYGCRVIGQRPQNNWRLNAPGIIGIDLEDRVAVRDMFAQHQFRSVLNCGGSCALKGCELDPLMAKRVNVKSVHSLLESAQDHQVRLVHLSIDLVFSGAHGGNLRETQKTDPVTVYGKTMVEAEAMVLDRELDSVVLRISLPMGVSFNGHAGAIDWIQSRFAKQKPATLYYDEVRTPTYVECLNEVIEYFFGSSHFGVFHAGGPLKWSLYQIAQIVNVAGGYDPDLLQGCYRMQAGPIPPRAGNVSMNCDRIKELFSEGPFMPWPLDQTLHPNSRNWHRHTRIQMGGLKMIQNSLYRRPQILLDNRH